MELAAIAEDSSTPASTPFARQVVRGFGWTALGRIAAQTVSWATTLIVVRLLAPQDYGLMAMAAIVLALAGHVADFAISSALVQRRELSPALTREAYGLAILAGLAVAALTYLAAPWIAAVVFAEPLAVDLIRALTLQLLASALAAAPRAMLERKLAFPLLSVIENSTLLATSGVVLLCAWSGLGVWSLVIGQLALAWARALAYLALPGCRIRPAFRFREARSLVRFSSLMTLNQVLWFLQDRIDHVIIGRLLGKEPLGVYAVALHVAALPQSKVQSSINTVAFPAFAAIQDDPQAGRYYLVRAARTISLAAAPVFLGLSAVADRLIPLVLGPAWTAAAAPMQIMALALPFRMLEHLMETYAQSRGQAGLTSVNMAFGLVAMALGALIGARWGVDGAAAGWALAILALFAFAGVGVARRSGFSFAALLRSAAPPFFAAALMWGAVVAAGAQAPAAAHPALVLALQCLGGAAVYLAALWLIDRSMLAEAAALLSPRARKASPG